MDINEEPSSKTTRKEFIRKSTYAAAGISLGVSAIGSPALGSVLGANDKVRVGFIGLGNRGSQLLTRFMANTDVEIAALSDVYDPYMERDYSNVSDKFIAEVGSRIPKMGEKFSGKVGKYMDFR
ncbi:MAG: hypothetical protein JSU77_03715 [Fidelibacterota bacterium]|nr:MAG: hypothetical protein JSU77_03715 [Candidatus Neomarinimicrobiota bacterium]